MSRWNVKRSGRRPRIAAIAAATALLAGAVGASGALASGPDHDRFGPGFGWPGAFFDHVVVDGSQLSHPLDGGTEPLTKPDDITMLDGRIFVAFQDGVGPQGEASSSGNLDSTIVELDLFGRELNQWDIVGKCDGLTADPLTGKLIATVNEDLGSSLYTIDPESGRIVDYDYSVSPLPHDGGTDAISIADGMILISASAPGTAVGSPAAPDASYPAVYRVDLDPFTRIATVHPLFGDEASATLTNVGPGFGTTTTLGLTDPDSNENVPLYAERFGGDFMETSQGDQQQIFVNDPGPHQTLSVLNLSASVDDTAWPTGQWGVLFVTDNGADTVDAITGPFDRGSEVVAATPCDSNLAPSPCPAMGFPANFLGQVNPWTGVIAPLRLFGPAVEPQGMLFVP